MLSSMSLRAKVLGAVVGAVVLGFALSFAVLIYNTTQLQTATALDHAKELARFEAQRITTKLEKALQLSRAYALALNQLRLDGAPSRAQALQLLKGMVAGQPEYVGASTGWEPNAFDAKDAAYVQAPHHDSTGRFMPYIFRDERGQVAVEVLVGYDKPGDGDYYLIPRSMRKPAIIEPYQYTVAGVDTLMTTLATPVLEGANFLGLVCIDMSLSDLQQQIQGIKPYGDGYASVVSHQGVYVADKDAQSIGKPLALDALTPQVLQAVQAGQEWVHEGADASTGMHMLRIVSPIRVQGVDTPWAMVLSIPSSSILAQVHRMRWLSLALGVGSALLVIGVAAVVLQRMVLRPLGGSPRLRPIWPPAWRRGISACP